MPVRSPPAQGGGLERSAVMGVALAGDSLAGTPKRGGLRCPRRGTLPQGASGPRLEGGAMPEEQAADGASDRELRLSRGDPVAPAPGEAIPPREGRPPTLLPPQHPGL